MQVDSQIWSGNGSIPATSLANPQLVLALGERALLAALDGNGRTPIGGHARLLPDGQLRLDGLTARADGSFILRRSIEGQAQDAVALGEALGAELRADSPADIFG